MPVDERTSRLVERARTRGWPLPADSSEAEVFRWLAASGPRDPSGVSRYLAEVWRERTDLRETFPGVPFDREQRTEFLRWAQSFAADESQVPTQLLDVDATLLAEDHIEHAQPKGAEHAGPNGGDQGDRGSAPAEEAITVVGYLRAELGLGSAARRMVTLCRTVSSNVQAIPYDHVAGPLLVDWPDVALEDIYLTDITLLCVNGRELPRLTRALGERILHSTYRIGLWFWELEVVSEAMAAGFAHLHEIWVTSDFVAQALRQSIESHNVELPVHVIPLGMNVEVRAAANVAEDLGLPDGVRIGCSFDYASSIERKNPLATIAAFRAAFPVPFELGETGPRLVLKTHGSAEFDRSRSAVAAAISDRPDITVIDRVFTDEEQHDFFRHLHAFISLHRSEGYGLGPLEAMANAIPTIATGYSGNLAFMTETNSWLVPAGRSMVPPDESLYPTGAVWAEPDIALAARALRIVVIERDSVAVRARASRGQVDVWPLISGESGTAWLRKRVAEIRSAR